MSANDRSIGMFIHEMIIVEKCFAIALLMSIVLNGKGVGLE